MLSINMMWKRPVFMKYVYMKCAEINRIQSALMLWGFKLNKYSSEPNFTDMLFLLKEF